MAAPKLESFRRGSMFDGSFRRGSMFDGSFRQSMRDRLILQSRGYSNVNDDDKTSVRCCSYRLYITYNLSFFPEPSIDQTFLKPFYLNMMPLGVQCQVISNG